GRQEDHWIGRSGENRGSQGFSCGYDQARRRLLHRWRAGLGRDCSGAGFNDGGSAGVSGSWKDQLRGRALSEGHRGEGAEEMTSWDLENSLLATPRKISNHEGHEGTPRKSLEILAVWRLGRG